MYHIHFEEPCWVHFIGIGGISMSGLAEVLLQRGFLVSGSDNQESELTKRLQEHGAKIFLGQRASNIQEGIQVVVYTAAVHEDNPELIQAKEMKLPLLTRAEFLGQLMRNYPTSVAVSGTHGKTTTTSMITEILLAADADPTISVGGMLDSIGGNIRVGKTGCFVTEACEYTNSFLSLYPTVGVILNIREDHLDFFRDIDDIRHSFRRFAQQIPEDGLLIIHSEVEDYEEIIQGLACRVKTVGNRWEDDYVVDEISYLEGGNGQFVVYEKGNDQGVSFRLSVPGEHNIKNALAAVAVGRELGVSMETIQQAMEMFGGIHRRFEYKGKLGGITIVDDYAHHPDEIRAALTAAKKCGKKRVICVFQPHTYTRTKALFFEFVKSLSLADKVVLAEIYAAREKDTLGVSSAQLQKALVDSGREAYYFSSFDEIENYLLETSEEGDLVITMGAGDVVKIGEKLLGQ